MERARAIADAPPRSETAADRRLAVVDVGSNTARLVLFQGSSEGSLRAVFEAKESLRLGWRVGPDGTLDAGAVERGLAGLHRFADRLEALGSPRTIGVATSAVREAPNGRTFVERVERETGLRLRILDGTEEARYAYLGVSSAWSLDHDLVCDLGGGSLQLVSTRRGAIRNSVSLPLGTLRLSQRFFEHDPPREREVEALETEVRESLRRALEVLGRPTGRLLGVGGTVRSLAKVAIGLREYPIARVHGYPLRPRDLEALRELLLELPSEKRRDLPGIGGDRADVIVAGLLVIDALRREAQVDALTVSGTGIREGLALEEIQAKLPASADELAHRSARAASEALDFSIQHGESVERLARQFFQAIADRQRWGEEERLSLSVAAWMHDAGIAIDLWRHARHSAYLIRNVPLWGLSQREVLLASMAAYLHEGDGPPSSWRKEFLPILKGSDIETARQLGAILYAAEALAGVEVKLGLPDGAGALELSIAKGAQDPPVPKALEKIRKPLHRELGLEVKLRDP
ncbi:MAG TPA: Ppx/GppA phosphatase family protein [Thermoplasmata archaeon]|nr:Ppx/GppA phosphatase family protein [Thermoplasmata archaeon]